MKLNIKEVEAYIGKLDSFLSDLNNLSWSGLNSQIKETTVTHLKNKVNVNLKDDIEYREFDDQINQPIEKVEEKINEILLEKYNISNAYRKYLSNNTIKHKILEEEIELDYESLKSLLRDYKNTQEQFYENILEVRNERRYGSRDGVYINKDEKKISFEYNTITEIKPIYNREYLDKKNTALKEMIFNLESKLDQLYIKKGIEFNPQYLMHKTIYELF